MQLRRYMAKHQRLPTFPAWPYEAAGADLIAIAFADQMLKRNVDRVAFPWFWPHNYVAAVALTHDVESADGLARTAQVASWEERHGFRSSFNIVSDSYPIDAKRLQDLVRRGHEIGSHAIHHDRSLFSSRSSFDHQLPLLRQAALRFGAVGFRSPATHRVIEWLKELPFSYDCSMPHSDPYEPIPGGTATVWPFFHGDVVELPYTAPQDHTLFNLLNHGDSSLWRQQFAQVVSCSGLFQLLTHPDAEYLGTAIVGEAYREILATIALREDVWVGLPRDITMWWRGRLAGITPPDNGRARWTNSSIALSPTTASEGTP
jgi:peptidoglycan/xylan/chitin deacetylase (PgdA/CDA1 family)